MTFPQRSMMPQGQCRILVISSCLSDFNQKCTLLFLRLDHLCDIPAVLYLVGGLHPHPLLQVVGQSLLAADEDRRAWLHPELHVPHEDAAFCARRLYLLDFAFHTLAGGLARPCCNAAARTHA